MVWSGKKILADQLGYSKQKLNMHELLASAIAKNLIAVAPKRDISVETFLLDTFK